MNKKIKLIDWIPIKEFDGYYINKTGQVKSTRNFKGTKEKILKGSKNQQGYKTITMIKNKKVYTKTLHRLLAKTFIPNPHNYPCINHIDGNRLNNSLDNLEWCTYGHNNKEAYRIGLKKGAWCNKKNEKHPASKRVIQYDLEGNYLKTWESGTEVERQLGISISSISQCCSGINKSAGRYKWRYKDDENSYYRAIK